VGRHRRNRGRKINGILLLDKPMGLSSNEALQQVKRMYNAQKAGHTGSLDPLATGLLPICFGEATKLSAFLLDADKSYLTECTLGERTASGDAEGEVIETRPVPEFSEQQILEVLNSFVGEIEQLPPMYSALKKDGQPLYKLARQGIEVEREPRTISIYKINLISFQANKLVIEVFCSKGTYIRTLAEDIGEKLGCGAYVSSLRRDTVGAFQIENAVSLDEITKLRDEKEFAAMDEHVLAMESALTDWPSIELSEDAAYYLIQGQPVLVPRAPTEGLVRLFKTEGDFLGIGQIQDDGLVAPKRLLSVV